MENNNEFDHIMDLNDEEKKCWEEIFAILGKGKGKDDNELKQEQLEKKFKLKFNHPLMEVHPFLKCREDIEKIRLLVIKDYPKYASYTNDKGKIVNPPMPDLLFLNYELLYYGILKKDLLMSEEAIKKHNTHVIEFGL